MLLRKTTVAVSAALFTLALAGCNSSSDTTASTSTTTLGSTAGVTAVADNLTTSTPIKHVVVIYNENVSFDHYFGTYPNATNPTGEPAFTAAAGTPSVNNLKTPTDLTTNNPNFTNAANGADAANPFRLDRTQAASADQNHAYCVFRRT